MNINPLIISALEPLGLPVEPNVCTVNPLPEEYIVFNYADERPALRADDTDIYDETTVQVHLFTKGNPQQNKKAIRRLLRASGFTILDTQEIYEDDTRFTHVVVEAWVEGDINDD
jgi:hypothetical protein